MTTRNDIERVLWKACDSFRGKIDSSRYKDYILSMLFVKYLNDVTLERRALYMEQYDGDERRVERAMSRERFSLDRESTADSADLTTTGLLFTMVLLTAPGFPDSCGRDGSFSSIGGILRAYGSAARNLSISAGGISITMLSALSTVR